MTARILLIEDNAANLELMSYLLNAFGYTPRTAGDGDAGLRAAHGEEFDLIICDVQMPVVDGYEVARRLKKDPVMRKIPLVAVTAMAMVGDRDKVLAAGFDGYIAKPIDPETFVPQVESFLPMAKRRAAAQPNTAATASPNSMATRHTILVVDNLPVNLELARSILEPHGFRVLTADGIELGMAAAREQSCDLILSDVCMSGESGYDFIRAVKADPTLCGIPFVFLTSTLVDEKDRRTALSLGATKYLTRPIEPEVLLAEIEGCLTYAERGPHEDKSERGRVSAP